MKKFFYSLLVLAMTSISFTSCEDVPMPYNMDNENEVPPIENGVKNLPYASASCNDWTAVTPKGAAWSLGSSYAKATGYDNANKTTTESEAWLVSPKIKTSTEPTIINFDHVIAYAKGIDLKANHKVLISDNFNGDIATATWIELNYTPVERTDTKSWDFYAAKTIQLPEAYLNKEVTIAFKFTCGASSTTWEVKNFSMKEGKAEETTPEVEPGQTIIGEGTAEKPYSVTDGIAKANASGVYVKGFIVGYIDGKSAQEGARFNADNATSNSNILLAASADEKDITKCMPIQLPSGAIRNGLNLQNNKDNLGKEVLIYGDLTAYFGQPGVKSVTFAKLGEKTIGTEPSAITDAIFNESFASSLGKFISVNEKEQAEGVNIWSYSSKFKCAVATAFINSKKLESNSWLISPAIDLSTATAPTLSFEQAGKFFATPDTDIKVLVSTDYQSGKPSSATWTELKINGKITNSDFTFTPTTSDLKAYAGKKNVRIAFQYNSQESSAGTWEIKNLIVK